MHILMMMAIGLVLLAGVHVGARALGRDGSSRMVARGAGLFVLFWLAVSAADFYLRVDGAGLEAGADIAAQAAVFGLPAILALALAVRASKRDPARPG
ncbi:hypothetical protein [uncultured Enterovirga sp.]|uniref:hypothetical protein n=1 Tax=uncultured Enterovirga sp. TaxID=2026352 RepID=UPI0035CAD054